MDNTELPAIDVRQYSLWYGDFQALFDVDLVVKKGLITSLIGPSGCGKSTLLRSVNRINERYPYVKTKGEIFVHGHDVNQPEVEVISVRKQVGMVFQRPNPLPISIKEAVCILSLALLADVKSKLARSA